MDMIFRSFVNQLPFTVVILIGLVIVWVKLSELCKRVDELKHSFERQVKWCLNHFQEKG